ncbi:hypothetical protein PQR02_35995, partial [Paraburkholderia sediminicola]
AAPALCAATTRSALDHLRVIPRRTGVLAAVCHALNEPVAALQSQRLEHADVRHILKIELGRIDSTREGPSPQDTYFPLVPSGAKPMRRVFQKQLGNAISQTSISTKMACMKHMKQALENRKNDNIGSITQ